MLKNIFLYLILLTICLASCQSGRNVIKLPKTADEKAKNLMGQTKKGEFQVYRDWEAEEIQAPLYTGCKTVIVHPTGLSPAQVDMAQEFHKEDCIELPPIYWIAFVYAYDAENEEWILLPALIKKEETKYPYESSRKFTKRLIRCNPNGEEVPLLVQD